MEVDDNKLHSEWKKRTQKQTACRLPTPKNKIIDVFNIRNNQNQNQNQKAFKQIRGNLR